MAWDELTDLAGGAPEDNASRIEALLSGAEDQAARRAVLLNAGAAIYVAGLAPSYREGVELADAALASGRALTVLHRLRAAVG
jgi:anthranilate phosphoribosyltransferase